MSRKNDNPLSLLIFIILVATGAFTFIISMLGHIMTFFFWLFTISMTEFGISPEAEIFVKVTTFAISYVLVGFIFSFDSGFRGKGNAMSIAYLIISTLIGFALSWLIMTVQQHILVIFWVLLILLIIISITTFVYFYNSRKNNDSKTV